MKVLFNTFFNGSSIQSQGTNNFSGQRVSSPITNLQSDIFVKSTNDVPFGEKINKEKIKDVAGDLAAIGVVGAPLILSIAGSAYLMKNMDVKDIFLPDGSYLMSVDELKTDKITANAEDGILKIDGTPIDIDANRYDVADVERGVFKNYDGSVDIDLANNKYIDLEHGVIIDPDNQMSFIENADGVFENVAIPALSSPNFKGSSMSGNSSYVRITPSREAYIEKNGYAPEDSPYIKHLPMEQKIPENFGDRIAVPNDNRSVTQKIIDFSNPLKPHENYPYDHSKSYDIFGREIVTIEKADGSMSKIGLDENLKAVLDKYHLKTDSLGEISDFCEKIKMKEYLLENHPVQASSFTAHTENLTEFLHRITENHSDVADVITNDAIVETVTNPELHTSILDTIRDIAEGI